VKEEDDFNIYTVFVTAYEIIIDTSPPPVNLSRHARDAWRPKHVVRIVLSSFAMALQFPILQLQPSILNYTCIAADTTFKLSICKLLKMSFSIYVCAYISFNLDISNFNNIRRFSFKVYLTQTNTVT